MNESRTLSISIRRPFADSYRYLADPSHLPEWSVFIDAIRPEGDGWVASTASGDLHLVFVAPNAHGILDHQVTLPSGAQVQVPMRVVANGDDGSEVIFTIFRQPGMSDDQFRDDIDAVETDLAGLKHTLEKTVERPVPAV